MDSMMDCNHLRKIPKERRFNESVESKNFIWLVGMIITPFLFFDLLKFHQFGSTVLPESLLEYVWYAVREVWKGTLLVADLEQVDKNRRVRIPQRTAQHEGDDLAQIGDNSQKPQMGNENLLEEIRF